jgi:hypothetical protein
MGRMKVVTSFIMVIALIQLLVLMEAVHGSSTIQIVSDILGLDTFRVSYGYGRSRTSGDDLTAAPLLPTLDCTVVGESLCFETEAWTCDPLCGTRVRIGADRRLSL